MQIPITGAVSGISKCIRKFLHLFGLLNSQVNHSWCECLSAMAKIFNFYEVMYSREQRNIIFLMEALWWWRISNPFWPVQSLYLILPIFFCKLIWKKMFSKIVIISNIFYDFIKLIFWNFESLYYRFLIDK